MGRVLISQFCQPVNLMQKTVRGRGVLMNTSKFLRFALVFVAFLLPAALFAQTSNGTIAGTVTDQSGAVVPKVDVKVESLVLNVVRDTTTDSGGSFRIESLPPGNYSVSFITAGFDTYQVNDVAVAASLTVTVNAKLTVSQVKHTVVVEAKAGEQIDTQSGQMATNMDTTEVLNLPQNTLNPAELALTLPGVQDANGYGFSNGVDFSVNGTRPRGNNFLIDGQDDNDYSISGQAFQPSNIGAIQEVTVLTNAYAAEYGRGGGSVGNYIYKSGTNGLHAQAWEIANNSFFAADPAQNKIADVSRPLFVENTFGFDIGGAAIKDKLFFFASIQWDRTRQRGTGPSQQFLPTADGVTTLESLLPNPNVQLLLNSLGGLVAAENPDGTGKIQGTCIGLGNGRPCVNAGIFQLSGVPEAGNDRQQYYRADWHLGPNDVLTGAYIRDDSTLTPDFFANPTNLPQFETLQGGPSQIFRGQWTHIFSSRMVNELRFSYTNIDFPFTKTAATLAGPLANIPGL